MDSESKNLWEVRLGIAGPLITLAGILIGLYTFEVGQRETKLKEIRLLFCKDEIDFKRQMWVKRLDIYMRLLETVGEIAKVEVGQPISKKLKSDLSTMYWGGTLLIDDRDVDVAMRAFREEVDRYDSGWSDSIIIKKRAYKLGAAVQHSVSKNGLDGSFSTCID